MKPQPIEKVLVSESSTATPSRRTKKTASETPKKKARDANGSEQPTDQPSIAAGRPSPAKDGGEYSRANEIIQLLDLKQSLILKLKEKNDEAEKLVSESKEIPMEVKVECASILVDLKKVNGLLQCTSPSFQQQQLFGNIGIVSPVKGMDISHNISIIKPSLNPSPSKPTTILSLPAPAAPAQASCETTLSDTSGDAKEEYDSANHDRATWPAAAAAPSTAAPPPMPTSRHVGSSPAQSLDHGGSSKPTSFSNRARKAVPICQSLFESNREKAQEIVSKVISRMSSPDSKSSASITNFHIKEIIKSCVSYLVHLQACISDEEEVNLSEAVLTLDAELMALKPRDAENLQ